MPSSSLFLTEVTTRRLLSDDANIHIWPPAVVFLLLVLFQPVHATTGPKIEAHFPPSKMSFNWPGSVSSYSPGKYTTLVGSAVCCAFTMSVTEQRNELCHAERKAFVAASTKPPD